MDILYELDEDLRVNGAMADDGYMSEHARMESLKVVAHPRDACPLWPEAAVARRWLRGRQVVENLPRR